MKNFIITSLCLVFAFSFVSCKKEGRHGEKDEQKSITLNVTVAPGATYQLNVSQYADEDDEASIATQATNYSISEIKREGVVGNYMYKYVPHGSIKTGVTATDKVVLKVAESDNRCHKDETDITINFTIK